PVSLDGAGAPRVRGNRGGNGSGTRACAAATVCTAARRYAAARKTGRCTALAEDDSRGVSTACPAAGPAGDESGGSRPAGDAREAGRARYLAAPTHVRSSPRRRVGGGDAGAAFGALGTPLAGRPFRGARPRSQNRLAGGDEAELLRAREGAAPGHGLGSSPGGAEGDQGAPLRAHQRGGAGDRRREAAQGVRGRVG